MRNWRMQILFFVLRPPLRLWLTWRFRLSIHHHGTKDLRPPFLVLGNHVNFWDPFLLAMAFGPVVHFLAADGNFRTRVMHTLMRLAGSVPKAKARTDMESLHTLRSHVAEGGIVALFPEGQRTWDGRSIEMLPATPKLARLLGAPVLMVQLRGAYLSTPRWAGNLRRGRLEMHVSQVLSRHELTTLPRGQIATRIADALFFDEGPWQEQTGQLFTSPRRAEHLERAFFACPECGSYGSIRSRGADISCTACDFSAWFGPSGRIYRRSGGAEGGAGATDAHGATNTAGGAAGGTVGKTSRRPLADSTVFRSSDWNAWQLEKLGLDLAGEQTGAVPYRIPTVSFLRGYRSRPLHAYGDASVELNATHMVITPKRSLPAANGDRRAGAGAGAGGPSTVPADFRIPVAEISGINVQYATQLEFYHRGRLHVLRMRRPEDSAFRLERSILLLQKLYSETKH